MLGAAWVMWLLVGLSVIALAIILERAYFFFTSSDDVARIRRELVDKLRGSDLGGAKSVLGASKSYEARIVAAALDVADRGHNAMEKKIEGETALARLNMERGLAYLGTVGNNAPFVGLLGTVIGIIRAFAELEKGAGQVSAGLMAEIGEALVATAIGIVVALPAVAFFNLFQRAIKSRLARAEALSRELLVYIPRSATELAPPAAEQ